MSLHRYTPAAVVARTMDGLKGHILYLALTCESNKESWNTTRQREGGKLLAVREQESA